MFKGIPSKNVISARGIFPNAGGDPICCWLTDDAVFQISTPASATQVLFVVVVPDLRVLHRVRRALTVNVNGKPAGNFDLKFGSSTLTVPLHPAGMHPAENHGTAVEFKARFSFVPKTEHLNGDTRKLSIILRSLRAE